MPNIDYSKSAVNLTNPDGVKTLLSDRSVMAEVMAGYQEQLKVSNKELYAKMGELSERMINNEIAIKTAIDLFGSFQDVERGFYGVKQKKVSLSYDAAKFETNYPQFAPAVIIKAVDTVKLNGLVKGGLIDNVGLTITGIITEKPSYSYIIRADAPAPEKEGK